MKFYRWNKIISNIYIFFYREMCRILGTAVIFLRYKISLIFVLFIRFDTSFLYHADHIVMRYTLDFIAIYKFFTTPHYCYNFLWVHVSLYIKHFCISVLICRTISFLVSLAPHNYRILQRVYYIFRFLNFSFVRIYNSSSDLIFYFIFIPFFFLFLYRRAILLFCFTCSSHSITENVS